MSTVSDKFGHLVEVERQLCEQAGPTLAAIVRTLEATQGSPCRRSG